MTETFSSAALAPPPLLERESELAELDALLADAGSARGRLALIEGPAGIGKTRLLEAAGERAMQMGLSVLSARGGELEGDYGFGVVRQLLEPTLVRAAPRDRAELMAGAARNAESVFAAAPADGPDDGAPGHATLHGLYWLVANLAERSPLLLAIDDVHWADPPSLRFLIHLARRLDGLPVALAISTRTGEAAVQPDLLSALVLEVRPPILRPRPLSEQAVERVLDTALGLDTGSTVPGACHQATGGNPFLLTELIAELREQSPSTTEIGPPAIAGIAPERIATAVRVRVARLGAAAPAFARAVAVLGAEADLARAAQLAGIGVADARDLARSLAHVAVLGRGDPVRFVHPIVRTAIYQDMSEQERSQLHAAAASLLRAQGADLESIAVHLLATDPAGEAATAEALREAARAALSRGSPETAARYLRRALVEPPPDGAKAEFLHALGHAEFVGGDRTGIERMQSALEAARDERRRGEVALALAQALVVDGRFDEAGEVLEEAIPRLPTQEDQLQLVLESCLAWIAPLSRSTYIRHGARLREVADQIEGATPAERTVLANLALRQTIEGGTATDAAPLAARAVGGGLLGELSGTLQVAEAILALIAAEEFALAERYLDAALERARAGGSLTDAMLALLFRAILEYRRGRLVRAEDDARSALEETELGRFGASAAAAAYLVHALVDRGQLQVAEAELERGGWTGALLPNIMSCRLLLARGRLRLAQGDTRRGIADLRLLADRADGWLDRDPANFPYRSTLAIALAGLGRAEEARAMATEELELARSWGSPRPIGVALRALGLVQGGERGIELLTEATSTLAASEARLEHARALVDLGSAVRRMGKRGHAKQLLAEGMDLAHRCGATALVERAHTELLAAGARPRRIAASGADALTPSERRVAQMAADGMANKEIAQALFVTLRTVETHLSHAYGKLGISSRQELPGALTT